VADAARQVEKAKSDSGRGPGFKKLYNLHISVARDGDRARQWAKRNTSYGLAGAYLRYPEVLSAIGLGPDEVAPVAEAYAKGLGIEEAARRVSDDLLRRAGFVVAGTPAECIPPCLEIKRQLIELGFDHLVFGVPLGPDVGEALELLGKEVIPAVLAAG
jgi:5,10-methylenetetrahydromethanopterin reductase